MQNPSTAPRIVDADGRPITTSSLAEPQTSRLAHLQRELQRHPTRGLTPTRLAQILDAAEQGDLIAQYDLFEDMEEKDTHIASEMGKRRRALLVDWEIMPPEGASAQEVQAAERLAEVVREIADFEDVLFDLTDAIGKGFACLEIDWQRVQHTWLPRTLTHRPQSWFVLHRGFQQELRLRTHEVVDGVPGAPLQPFGWIVHMHKAKSGYLERTALFRQLAWPFLFKNYSIGDLAEFLEVYGRPTKLGKYPASASEKEKVTLLKALVGLGHNAAGIVPEGMALEFHDAATGDPDAFELMINWCERSVSKAVLGATLTSGADGAASTNALGNVHNEVRKDLRDADMRQVSATLTRELVYPLAALNGLAQGGMRRCPRFVLNAREFEDLQAYASALPALVRLGVRPTVAWVHEKLGIPMAQEGEAVLGEPAPDATPLQPAQQAEPADAGAPGSQDDGAGAPAEPGDDSDERAAQGGALAVLARRRRAAEDVALPAVPMTARLSTELRGPLDGMIDKVRALVERAQTLEQVRDGLEALLPDMTLQQYADAMAQALAAAALAGRFELVQEAAEAAGGRGR